MFIAHLKELDCIVDDILLSQSVIFTIPRKSIIKHTLP